MQNNAKTKREPVKEIWKFIFLRETFLFLYFGCLSALHKSNYVSKHKLCQGQRRQSRQCINLSHFICFLWVLLCVRNEEQNKWWRNVMKISVHKAFPGHECYYLHNKMKLKLEQYSEWMNIDVGCYLVYIQMLCRFSMKLYRIGRV